MELEEGGGQRRWSHHNPDVKDEAADNIRDFRGSNEGPTGFYHHIRPQVSRSFLCHSRVEVQLNCLLKGTFCSVELLQCLL